jgi:hypothetical protein
MALSVTQSRSLQGTTQAATIALAFTGTPAVNSLIVVCFGSYLSPGTDIWLTGTVADNQGNTYNRATSIEREDGYTGIFYGVAATASGTFTITGTPSSSSYNTIAIHEIGGAATASPLDGTPNTGTGASTGPATGATTTTVADAIVIGVVSHIGPTRTITVGTNFNQMQEIESASSGQPINTEYRIVAATGSYAASWTLNNSESWSCCVAAFEQAAGTKSIPPGLIRPQWRSVTRRVYR